MGYAISDFFKAWGSNKRTTAKPVVALISDEYFFFDEIKLPQGSLQKEEINSMAQMAIESAFPMDDKKIFSGFFTNRGKNCVTIFVASKNRILSEIPNLKTCTYWLPERFCRENVKSSTIIKTDEKCATISVDGDGSLKIQGKKLDLFSEDFWNAEMHEQQEKTIARTTEKINGWYKKIIFPLISVTSILFMLVISLVVIRSSIEFRQSTLVKKWPKITRIIERKKLYDEICAFSEGKASYFKRLDEINKIRPAQLFFSQFTMNGPKVMQLVGICDSIATLNLFVENLKKEFSMRRVPTLNVSSTSKGTTFNLQVEYL
ncbi:MAG: PilN domain-containing protein [Puniceicoccales bacterium]|jgi:hypothetical protein|nr:PilN domain-containing protein [Puniceicoccales bacterium]